MSNATEYCITIRFQESDRKCAEKFAAAQPTPEQNQQVYRNTLAVLAVNTFLQELRYETDLDAGDSWHPVIRMFHNVADLVLPGIGKIECCPVQLGKSAISLPEVGENRIAYVAVGFAEPFDKVKLLGFMPAVGIGGDTEEISLSELKPVEELLDYLYRIESGILELQPEIEELISSLDEDDPVEKAVREIFAFQSHGEIVAKLHRVYCSNEESDWGSEGRKALAEVGSGGGSLGGNNRGFSMNKSLSTDTSSNIEDDVAAQLNRIAEDLLEKLAEIWGDGDG